VLADFETVACPQTALEIFAGQSAAPMGNSYCPSRMQAIPPVQVRMRQITGDHHMMEDVGADGVIYRGPADQEGLRQIT